jgi:hypothetical protein
MLAPPPPSSQFAQPPHRAMETVEVNRAQKKGGMGRLVVAMAIAAVVVLGLTIGGAYLIWGGPKTGTISVIVAPENADPRVYLDRVQRGHGRALSLEHVPEGDRLVEVRADGFRTFTRTVTVRPGTSVAVPIVLLPSVVAAPPSPAPPLPTPIPMPAVATAIPAIAPALAPPAPAPAPAPIAHAPTPAPVAIPTPGPAPTTPAPTPPTNVATTPRPDHPAEPTEHAAGGHGYLVIQTLPWARVFLDGRDTGRNTPVRQLRVRPGDHTIGLRTPDGTMHSVTVTVSPGETERVVRQF